jgi:hypothetical protein
VEIWYRVTYAKNILITKTTGTPDLPSDICRRAATTNTGINDENHMLSVILSLSVSDNLEVVKHCRNPALLQEDWFERPYHMRAKKKRASHASRATSKQKASHQNAW